MSPGREPVRELPQGLGVPDGDCREAGRRWVLRRGGSVLAGLGFTLCVGLASCAIAAAARPPPLLAPCEEPVEVVDQVDHGWALLVGQDESDVRFVPAAARPPPLSLPCAEPVEVVDQVDHGWALLVGRDEGDVRLVPAGTLVEGMALSRGRQSPACGTWLRRRVAAARRGAAGPTE